MSDDPGVMGNLPRARPGRRSEKRGEGGTARSAAAKTSGTRSATKGGGAKARSARSAGARSKPRTPKRTTPRVSGTRQSRPKQPEPAASQGFDPVGDAVRVAGKVAGAGLKVAGGVLKRLPGR